MNDPHSSLPQAEADAIASGTRVSVKSTGSSSAGPLTDSDGNVLPKEFGMGFMEEMGVFENEDGSITESPSSLEEVFEHEVAHVIDMMAGKPLIDRTFDSSGLSGDPTEVSAVNRTNRYRENSGIKRQRLCHSCSQNKAYIWKKYGSP